jgi:hypothetical protein
MRGIVVNCRTGEVKEIDGGLPVPEPPPYVEPISIDLAVLAQKLKEFDQLKADFAELKKKLKSAGID